MSDTIPSVYRAGFWRRFLALVVDGLVIAVPFQILAAILFPLTNGAVQMTGGFAINACQAVTAWPNDLVPPPPAGANQALDCKVTFFGAQTAHVLTVSRITRSGNTFNQLSYSYALDREGNQVSAWTLDPFALIGLLAYLILLEHFYGATFGKRLLAIRVMNRHDLSATRIGWGQAIARYASMHIGAVPLLLIGLASWLSAASPEQFLSGGFGIWFFPAAGAAFIWIFVLVVQIVRKQDPVYDCIAGTAVVSRERIVARPMPDGTPDSNLQEKPSP